MKYLCVNKDILATLAYFNMFDYPLRKREIFSFLGHCDNFSEFDNVLNNLVDELAIFKIGEFYSLQNNLALAERRNRGNNRATNMLKSAEKAANIINKFPFVRAVAISGSLSKYFADENADIDFFIITAPNRLWISRTILHLFKKITFLFNMQDHFCMNYFIDEAQPSIVEKNFYTAMEIATLIPLHGGTVFDKFYKANDWIRIFFPNKYIDAYSSKNIKNSRLKNILEKAFNNRLGDRLDNYLMNLTAKRWTLKTTLKKKNSKGYLMSICTDKHFSKPNPEHFQKVLLQNYENSLNDVYKRLEHSRQY
jgi:hypothetical protein